METNLEFGHSCLHEQACGRGGHDGVAGANMGAVLDGEDQERRKRLGKCPERAKIHRME
jgi:hypothetical protein